MSSSASRMTREEAIAYFDRLEHLHAAASTDWQRGETDEGEGLLARLIPQHPPTPVVIFDRCIDRNDVALLVEFYAGMAFLLKLARSLRRRLDQYEPPDTADDEKRYDPAQNCGQYCNKPAFQRWLIETEGLVLDPEIDARERANRTATKVRGLLGIQSRTDLNTDAQAAELWHAMRSRFKKWMKS